MMAPEGSMTVTDNRASRTADCADSVAGSVPSTQTAMRQKNHRIMCLLRRTRTRDSWRRGLHDVRRSLHTTYETVEGSLPTTESMCVSDAFDRPWDEPVPQPNT